MGKGRSAGEHGQTVAWGGCSCGFLKICFSIIFSPSISRASELINWRGRGCCCAFQEKGDLREGSMPGQMEEWVAFSHGRLGAPWLISGFSDLQPLLLSFSSLQVMLSILPGTPLIASHSGTTLSSARVLREDLPL